MKIDFFAFVVALIEQRTVHIHKETISFKTDADIIFVVKDNFATACVYSLGWFCCK